MTIAQEALIYKQSLAEWAEQQGGIVVVASNLKDMWEQAYKVSDRPRVLICYAGENARGPFSRAAATHRVDRLWQIAVTRGRGLNAERGTSLTNQVGNADPFYDVVEYVRDRIRAINNTSVEAPLDYKANRPMSSGNLILDGYIIDFSTAHDLPQLKSQ
jgi:hypothetical protein